MVTVTKITVDGPLLSTAATKGLCMESNSTFLCCEEILGPHRINGIYNILFMVILGLVLMKNPDNYIPNVLNHFEVRYFGGTVEHVYIVNFKPFSVWLYRCLLGLSFL